MRWPLKYQIMIPMTAVMLGTVVAVSLSQAYLAAAQTRRQTAARIRNVTSTLAASTAPMKSAVLEQMKGLAGAEFVLQDAERQVIVTTRDDWNASDIPAPAQDRTPDKFELSAPVTIAGERYFHTAILRRPRAAAQRADTLHVFYSESVYRHERRRATLPAIGIGAGATIAVVLLALLTASRVSRPLDQLRRQVNRIADGDFHPIPPPRRCDEVQDLSHAVNDMVEKLSRYEQQVRRTEQLRLLGQLGSGLAHQLRNSATGARMALDIHRRECTSAATSESLDVATRQLVLMENYLARFLSLGATQKDAHRRLDLADLVRNLLPLVRPAAQHTGVTLHTEIPDGELFTLGDPTALQQLVLNLLINAIEAAGDLSRDDEAAGHEPQVLLGVSAEDKYATLVVEDTGRGPPADIAESIFEPFVTAKRDGVGLGLAVAREVALDHGGELRWERVSNPGTGAGRTRFIVVLPTAAQGERKCQHCS